MVMHMASPASDNNEAPRMSDLPDARVEYAGYTILVYAIENEQGVWLPRVTVLQGAERIEMPQLTQAWRGWLTRGEAVRDGLEQAHLLLSGDRHQP
ncbi:hypothetical protein CXP34_12795 [Ralstonia mannitolilytica]|nr:hypothetical protein CXP34_12795 [Ralstonia mannitolilytica]